jgi:hypothetical protein
MMLQTSSILRVHDSGQGRNAVRVSCAAKSCDFGFSVPPLCGSGEDVLVLKRPHSATCGCVAEKIKQNEIYLNGMLSDTLKEELSVLLERTSFVTSPRTLKNVGGGAYQSGFCAV